MGFTNAVAIITGAFIRTAVIGQRIEINGPSHRNSIAFYTGSPDEVLPGLIESELTGLGFASLALTSPMMTDTGTAAFLKLTAYDPPSTDADATLSATSTRIETSDQLVLVCDSGELQLGDGVDFLRVASTPTAVRLELVGHEAFTAPTLLNSWVDFGASFQPVGYRLDPDGYVTLRGLVKNGSAANAGMFTLPAGLRPLGLGHTQTSTANDALCRIFVSTTGTVSAVIGGSTTWTSLNGVRFPVF